MGVRRGVREVTTLRRRGVSIWLGTATTRARAASYLFAGGNIRCIAYRWVVFRGSLGIRNATRWMGLRALASWRVFPDSEVFEFWVFIPQKVDEFGGRRINPASPEHPRPFLNIGTN